MESNNRILIVDDQEDLREQLARLLVSTGRPNKTSKLVKSMRMRLMGLNEQSDESEANDNLPRYDIDTVGQGEEAYEMVKAAIENNAPYAVIFTDMRMPPGWDGLKTAKKIREIDKNIEIVIMTAYADHGQDEISREIGFPEKLLYIKKPFQAEEIFQLALSLTSKWNFEKLEGTRRKWLEELIRCIRKVKMTSKTDEFYVATLESLLNFTQAQKGLISVFNDNSEKWELCNSRNLEQKAAESFLVENGEFLTKCDTIQKSFKDSYLIPLKSNELAAIVAIYDAKTYNDPEWYKLMNALVITSIENLENMAYKKKNAPLEKIDELISMVCGIRDSADTLKKQYADNEKISLMLDKIDQLLEAMKR